MDRSPGSVENVMQAPATTPGSMRGNVIRVEVRSHEAPQVADASSIAGSICVSAALAERSLSRFRDRKVPTSLPCEKVGDLGVSRNRLKRASGGVHAEGFIQSEWERSSRLRWQACLRRRCNSALRFTSRPPSHARHLGALPGTHPLDDPPRSGRWHPPGSDGPSLWFSRARSPR